MRSLQVEVKHLHRLTPGRRASSPPAELRQLLEMGELCAKPRSRRTLRFEVELPANQLGPGWRRKSPVRCAPKGVEPVDDDLDLARVCILPQILYGQHPVASATDRT